jgi:hypothetical protein
MKQHLIGAVVCLASLYAVDAYFFDGWYFGIAAQVIQRAYTVAWW